MSSLFNRPFRRAQTENWIALTICGDEYSIWTSRCFLRHHMLFHNVWFLGCLRLPIAPPVFSMSVFSAPLRFSRHLLDVLQNSIASSNRCFDHLLLFMHKVSKPVPSFGVDPQRLGHHPWRLHEQPLRAVIRTRFPNYFRFALLSANCAMIITNIQTQSRKLYYNIVAWNTLTPPFRQTFIAPLHYRE